MQFARKVANPCQTAQLRFKLTRVVASTLAQVGEFVPEETHNIATHSHRILYVSIYICHLYHPSIPFLYCSLCSGSSLEGAYPNWLCAIGKLHSGLVASQSQLQTPMDSQIQRYRDQSCWIHERPAVVYPRFQLSYACSNGSDGTYRDTGDMNICANWNQKHVVWNIPQAASPPNVSLIIHCLNHLSIDLQLPWVVLPLAYSM